MNLRVMPHSPELERDILGNVFFTNGSIFSQVYAVLTSHEVFYDKNHSEIYKSMVNIYRNGGVPDLITVIEDLRTRGMLESVGGAYALTGIMNESRGGSSIETRCLALVEYFLRRQLIDASIEVMNGAYNLEDPFDLNNYFINSFAKSATTKTASSWVSMEKATMMFSEARDRVASGIDAPISTTFKSLDRKNGGFRPGDFIIVGGRPSMGKSAFTSGLAINTASEYGAVGIINLEMSIPQVYGRLLSYDSKIPYWLLDKEDMDVHTLMQKMTDISELPIFFSSNVRVNINSIRSSVEYLVKNHGCKLIIIDYLQLIGEDDERRTREQAISRISRGLKTLAMQCGIPIVALSQLSRKSEERTVKKPQLSDLRESGSLEQDADIVMLLHRDWRVNVLVDEYGNSTENQADLIIPKWRNGDTVSLKLHFDGETMTFSEIEQELF